MCAALFRGGWNTGAIYLIWRITWGNIFHWYYLSFHGRYCLQIFMDGASCTGRWYHRGNGLTEGGADQAGKYWCTGKETGLWPVVDRHDEITGCRKNGYRHIFSERALWSYSRAGYAPERVNVNQFMVRAGVAWVYEQYKGEGLMERKRTLRI